MGIFIDFRAIFIDFSMGAHAEINKKAKKSKVKSINVYAKSIKMCARQNSPDISDDSLMHVRKFLGIICWLDVSKCALLGITLLIYLT